MPNASETFFPTKPERKEERRKETRDRKLLDEFFDHPTLLAISRLVTQGQFLQLDYPISTGKEGGVFRATTEGGGFRAVKVYRIGNAVLRHLPAYALEELKHTASLSNYARLIYAWTRREHTVLRKMREAEVRCPETYGYLRNVLVMEFIGTGELPAPRLRDAVVEDLESLYRSLTAQLYRMVVDAKLVHGDLSPYNVLYHEGAPVLIDVAQAIATDHPQARALHERDCAHFARYLEKLGVDTSPEEFLRLAGGDKLPHPE
ncbi:MAG: serine protein kinase RIO [Candidatus Lutacidiplasmatales archaeon]